MELQLQLEQCFAPTRRLRAIWEEVHDVDPFLYAEVQLAVPAEEFLNYHWDWDDLWAFISADVRLKFLWLTDDTFIAVGDVSEIFDDDTPYNTLLIASSTTTSGQVQTLTLIKEMDADASAEACSVFWRAIETDRSANIVIQGDDNYPSQLPSGPSLSQFLRGRPLLQSLDFLEFAFTEEHCRALATLQRTDLKIKLSNCSLAPQGAKDAFIEWFRNNQVVTELNCCFMDSSILCALSGNKSLKKLSMEIHPSDFSNEEEIRSLAQALTGNMGIEHLTLCAFHMHIETWGLLVSSLSTHPRIKILSLRGMGTADHIRSTMMGTIIQLLHFNTVVLAIELPGEILREAVYRNSIVPRLEMNRSFFEVQRQAVKRADLSIRPQLLGRALHVVRYNPNLVFQFLSENVPAFVRTAEEEEDSAIPLANVPAIVSGQKRNAP
jgi:hypothetical protein